MQITSSLPCWTIYNTTDFLKKLQYSLPGYCRIGNHTDTTSGIIELVFNYTGTEDETATVSSRFKHTTAIDMDQTANNNSSYNFANTGSNYSPSGVSGFGKIGILQDSILNGSITNSCFWGL